MNVYNCFTLYHNTQQKLRYAFIFLQLLYVNYVKHVKPQYFLFNRRLQTPA